MSRFYNGAKRIDHWMNNPRADRFMDALALWWIALAGSFLIAVVTAVLVLGGLKIVEMF